MTFKPKHLGKTTQYPTTFDASLLEAIPRAFGRESLGLSGRLPFIGCDVWQAYEVSWLNTNGQGVAAVLSLVIPAQSYAIVESKSFKLYLQSFHMTQFASADIVQQQVKKDISALLESQVDLSICLLTPGLCHMRADTMWSIQQWQALQQVQFQLVNLDFLEFECSIYDPDPRLLKVSDLKKRSNLKNQGCSVFISDCFRSLCPVTGQPDFASILVMAEGVEIHPLSLGQYLNSYRLHQGFHEQCIEIIFLDIAALGAFKTLSVIGRFTRRGGIDINPERHLNVQSVKQSKQLQLRQIRQ